MNNNSKAEQMFNELGWDLKWRDTTGVAYTLGSYLYISFSNEWKQVNIENYNRDTTQIDIDLLNAITEQIKELNWYSYV